MLIKRAAIFRIHIYRRNLAKDYSSFFQNCKFCKCRHRELFRTLCYNCESLNLFRFGLIKGYYYLPES